MVIPPAESSNTEHSAPDSAGTVKTTSPQILTLKVMVTEEDSVTSLVALKAFLL